MFAVAKMTVNDRIMDGATIDSIVRKMATCICKCENECMHNLVNIK